MSNINVTIKNLPQIRRAFSMSPVLMTKELNMAIRKSILVVESRSKLKTPVDSGRLRASHTTRFENLRGSVFTDTEYDTFVHDGTRYQTAQPYMRNAVESSDNDIQRFFTTAVNTVLYKIGKMT